MIRLRPTFAARTYDASHCRSLQRGAMQGRPAACVIASSERSGRGVTDFVDESVRRRDGGDTGRCLLAAGTAIEALRRPPQAVRMCRPVMHARRDALHAWEEAERRLTVLGAQHSRQPVGQRFI